MSLVFIKIQGKLKSSLSGSNQPIFKIFVSFCINIQFQETFVKMFFYLSFFLLVAFVGLKCLKMSIFTTLSKALIGLDEVSVK